MSYLAKISFRTGGSLPPGLELPEGAEESLPVLSRGYGEVAPGRSASPTEGPRQEAGSPGLQLSVNAGLVITAELLTNLEAIVQQSLTASRPPDEPVTALSRQCSGLPSSPKGGTVESGIGVKRHDWFPGISYSFTGGGHGYCTHADGNRGGAGDPPLPSEPNFTMRRLMKLQAAAAAMAFNVAYEQENETPSYDRLGIAPFRLGSGLAASALPVATAPPPLAARPCPPPKPGLLTAALEDPAAHTAAALTYTPFSGAAGASNDKERERPAKRRRLEGGAGGSGCGSNFAVTTEFAFVLNRCFNCGSYGHDLRNCSRPRNQAAIETRQQEFSERRSAALAEQRRARLAEAAGQRQKAHRRKASHGRYFSAPETWQEVEEGAVGAAAADADAEPAEVASALSDYLTADPGDMMTWPPAGVRPGAISTALAVALGLGCSLDPPPWLASMAVHGIPPAYCRNASRPAGDPSPEKAVAAENGPAMEEVKRTAPPHSQPSMYGLLPQPAAPDASQGSASAGLAPIGIMVMAEGKSDAVALQTPLSTPPEEEAPEPVAATCLETASEAVAAAAPKAETVAVTDPEVGAAGTADAEAVLAVPEGNGYGAKPLRPAIEEEKEEEDDALRLMPLLRGEPCHVPYAGLNAPFSAAACRERWRRALHRARQAVAFVRAARRQQHRRQEQRQAQERQPEQQPQQQQPQQQEEQQQRPQMRGQWPEAAAAQQLQQHKGYVLQQQMFEQHVHNRYNHHHHHHHHHQQQQQQQQQQQVLWQQQEQQQQQVLLYQQQMMLLQQQQEHWQLMRRQQPWAAGNFPFCFGGPGFQGGSL